MRFAPIMEHNKALEGAAVGGGSGIVLGRTLSCLMALGILVIPDVGLLHPSRTHHCRLCRRGGWCSSRRINRIHHCMRMPAFEAITIKGRWAAAMF